jgi:integrase
VKHSRQATNVQFLYISNGTYYARTYAGGREKWTSLRTRVKAIAKRKLHELLAEHHANRDSRRSVESGNATMGELARVYMERQNLRTDLKAGSKVTRDSSVKSILKTWTGFAAMLPARVTDHEVAAWAQRHHAEWSAPFHNACIDSLRGIFAIAIDRGIITRNPTERLTKASVPHKRLELPTSEQFEAIVRSIRGSGTGTSKLNAALVEFLAYSGMRLREAGRVGWPHVDLGSGRIWVEPGKNLKGRYVPIVPKMRDLLERIRAEKHFAHLTPNRHGYVLASQTCEESLTRACGEIGIKRLTHHDLRHYFATKCIESGVDIPTVSRWLGHSDGGALAMKTYGHLRSEHFDRMAQKVTF